MTTEAYQRIQAKLQATGRLYLDGFSGADLDSLSSSEKSAVQAVLETRVRCGDGVSLQALQHLATTPSFGIFVEQLLSSRGGCDLFAAQLTTSLCECTSDDSAWERIINLLPLADTAGRRWLVNWLSGAKISELAKVRLIQILSDLIGIETNDVILLAEVTLLLSMKGIAAKSQAMVAYAERLRSNSREVRLLALGELRNLR